MNRETKRMLQRQGSVGPDGAPARREPGPRPAPKPASERTSPTQFVSEVRSELKKVAWPNRAEVTNYTIVVLVMLALMMVIIFALDYVFAQFVLRLFER